MRKWFGLIAVLLMLVVTAGGASAEQKSPVYQARYGVVYLYESVKVYDLNNNLLGEEGLAAGTAFFVGNGKEAQYLVTCAHCVDNYYNNGQGEMISGELNGTAVKLHASLELKFDENTSVQATLVEYDAVRDIALLKIEKPTTLRKPLKIKEPTERMVGDTVYAIGFPYTSDERITIIKYDVDNMTSTKGSISRLITEAGSGVREVQIDAEITHGNSGGPLIDEKGNVIGVCANGDTFTSGEKAMYAVSMVEVIEMLKRHNVKYTMASSFPVVLVVVLGVVIVLLVVLLVVLLTGKGGKVSRGGKGSSDRVLVCEAGALAGQSFPLKRGQRVTIGRNPDCQIRFPANTAGVSKLHCSVVYDGEKVMIRDENSSAGTYIDGQKLTPGTATTLHRGHPVGLGSKAQILVLHSKK